MSFSEVLHSIFFQLIRFKRLRIIHNKILLSIYDFLLKKSLISISENMDDYLNSN